MVFTTNFEIYIYPVGRVSQLLAFQCKNSGCAPDYDHHWKLWFFSLDWRPVPHCIYPTFFPLGKVYVSDISMIVCVLLTFEAVNALSRNLIRALSHQTHYSVLFNPTLSPPSPRASNKKNIFIFLYEHTNHTRSVKVLRLVFLKCSLHAMYHAVTRLLYLKIILLWGWMYVSRQNYSQTWWVYICIYN
jgi:hypothetical protein